MVDVGEIVNVIGEPLVICDTDLYVTYSFLNTNVSTGRGLKRSRRD